jgi:hypothetical protein
MTTESQSEPNPPYGGHGISRRQALGAMGALMLPWPLMRAQPPKPPSGLAGGEPHRFAVGPEAEFKTPDLANLDPLLQAVARDHPPQLSYLDPKWRAVDEWKQAARPVFLSHLSYDPASVPLVAEKLRVEKRDGYTLEVINISATPTYRIPARVLVPDGNRARRPAVVAMHCHSGKYTFGHEKIISSPGDLPALDSFRRETYGRPWAEALVRRGYVVIVIDAFYFGERRLRAEAMDPARIYPEAREAHRICQTTPPGSAEWHAAADRVSGHFEHLTAKTIFAGGSDLAWDSFVG